MKNDNDHVISVAILNRTYKIKCTPDEEYQLRDSARYVDQQMRKVSQSGTIMNTDRVAVVTALNICHELLQLKQEQTKSTQLMNQQLQNLLKRLKNSLGTEEGIAV